MKRKTRKENIHIQLYLHKQAVKKPEKLDNFFLTGMYMQRSSETSSNYEKRNQIYIQIYYFNNQYKEFI